MTSENMIPIGLRPRASTLYTGAFLPSISLVASMRLRMGVRLWSCSREAEAYPLLRGSFIQPTISLWSSSGISALKAMHLEFSFSWLAHLLATGFERSYPTVIGAHVSNSCRRTFAGLSPVGTDCLQKEITLPRTLTVSSNCFSWNGTPHL